ncbi:Na+/H+ antiporter NhaA [Pseudolysinimonas sp.]|uniref:Na+/H+ antiporter NhaA n=1 Tax=Pseudolysinimonas sp. TaxID=2680009 RepID=UPI00286C8C61|nr:Na+/H+ antiporter NhaA [Pseudolysinimonas sp.]
MNFRSERLAAVLLVIAAAAGLLLANSAVGPGLLEGRAAHLDIPWLGIELSAGHWITDGLLAVFFFLAAIELRHELSHGELDSPRKALIPVVAAVGGVIVPAAIFLLLVREPDLARGWPIPTATDIAFALGILSLVARGLPPRVRAFLLALAVIDDLIAILLIAFFFTTDLTPLPLLGAVPVILAFGFLSHRVRRSNRGALIPVLIVLGLAAWWLVLLSGVHPTVAGVALGLIMAVHPASRTRHLIEPWSNIVILPLFAFAASLVLIPDVREEGLSPVFFAIAVALPVGKILGIGLGGFLGSHLVPKAERRAALPAGDIAVVATLGGIGFTVSLLMNELAYREFPEVAAEGTLGVLTGSAIAAVVGIIVAALRAAQHRRHEAATASNPT